jgi:tetratricopeptide (TPR) repeat protein
MILGGEHMTAPQSNKSSSVSAYEHYVLGQQYIIKRTRSDIETAKRHFDAALELDPDYAPALAGLADAILLLTDDVRCYGDTPVMQARATARPLIERALELSPDAFEVHAAKSLYHDIANEAGPAIEHAEKAIERNPSYGRAYNQLSMALGMSGDPAAPIMSVVRKGFEVDPTSLLNLQSIANQYINRLRLEDAEKIAVQMETTHPDSDMTTFLWGSLEQARGNYAKAIEIYLSAKDPMGLSLLVFNIQIMAISMGWGEIFDDYDTASAFEAYANTGQMDNANALAEKVMSDEKNLIIYDTMLAIAEWQARGGDYEATLETLRPFDEPDPDNWSPHFALSTGCAGALLSWYARLKLDKTTSAALYLSKLEQVLKVTRGDPDRTQVAAEYLEMSLAVAKGEMDRAIEILEGALDQTMWLADSFVTAVWMEPLFDDLRFMALKARVQDHLASERRKCEEAGLIDRMKALLAG